MAMVRVASAPRRRRVLDELGEAEVEHLGEAGVGDDDVAGLDVAVHDAGGVRDRERIGNLQGVLQRLPNREPARPDEGLERLSLDELHRDELLRRSHPDFVDGDDVRMVQRRGGLRLLQEPALAVVVQGRALRQELHRHESVQEQVAGAIHDAHPSFADLLEQLVVADCGSRH